MQLLVNICSLRVLFFILIGTCYEFYTSFYWYLPWCVCAEAVWGPRAGDGGCLSRWEADLQFQSEAVVQGDGCAGVQVQLWGDDAQSRRCERCGVRAATAACSGPDRLATSAHLVNGILKRLVILQVQYFSIFCCFLSCTNIKVFLAGRNTIYLRTVQYGYNLSWLMTHDHYSGVWSNFSINQF